MHVVNCATARDVPMGLPLNVRFTHMQKINFVPTQGAPITCQTRQPNMFIIIVRRSMYQPRTHGLHINWWVRHTAALTGVNYSCSEMRRDLNNMYQQRHTLLSNDGFANVRFTHTFQSHLFIHHSC